MVLAESQNLGRAGWFVLVMTLALLLLVVFAAGGDSDAAGGDSDQPDSVVAAERSRSVSLPSESGGSSKATSKADAPAPVYAVLSLIVLIVIIIVFAFYSNFNSWLINKYNLRNLDATWRVFQLQTVTLVWGLALPSYLWLVDAYNDMWIYYVLIVLGLLCCLALSWPISLLFTGLALRAFAGRDGLDSEVKSDLELQRQVAGIKDAIVDLKSTVASDLYFQVVDGLDKLCESMAKETSHAHNVCLYLCMSTDDKLTRHLFSPEAASVLLYSDHQQKWARKIPKDIPFVLTQSNKNDPIINKMNEIIQISCKTCIDTLVANNNKWSSVHQISVDAGEPLRPVAIRILFSDVQDAIYAGRGFASSGVLFPGIAQSRIWNLWMPYGVFVAMKPRQWMHQNAKVTTFLNKSSFHSPPDDWGSVFREFAKQVFHLDYNNLPNPQLVQSHHIPSTCFENNCGSWKRPDAKRLLFISLGHEFYVNDSDPKNSKRNGAPATWMPWLDSLVVILMAMHYKKLLSFDDMGIELSHQLRGAPQTDGPIYEIEKSINDFIDL